MELPLIIVLLASLTKATHILDLLPSFALNSKRIHSHNDYWREVPLYTALSYGVQSVEADVWNYPQLSQTEVFVGHHESSLTLERTLNSLYIDPLVDILQKANPVNPFTNRSINHDVHATGSAANGVFDTNPKETLFLFIDIKTNGYDTWKIVNQNLQKLRDLGYLTTFNGTSLVYSAVTVIGTGNTPFEYIQGINDRDIFFDGDLLALNETMADGVTLKYNKSISPIASTSLKKAIGTVDENGISKGQKMTLKTYIDQAHSLGIMVRIWDLEYWPVWKKFNIYKTLREIGCDFLNADDLQWVSETMY
ncbi:hypothetical protein WICPIJ_009070 [Wickerhamomyces pijperi]|uniref:Altered inheritance of mitochondria protein 6 n=1 Tax=Wickerhamomyces pijperi TaxID=599730 RepID=A0A9P8TFA8_WICPI|nr:hypothetical protein WICPIJ_009070 [Wickerhamomyces pijperi]